MRQIILAAATLIVFASNADAAARIPAPAISAFQLVGGFANGTRPALPRPAVARAAEVAQIAPTPAE